MSLLNTINHLTSSIGKYWHTRAEPWLTTFLSNTVHAEVSALVPLAQKAVLESEGALIRFVTAGNFDGLGTTVGKIITDTAKEAQGQLLKVGVNSLVTAVNVAIAGHEPVQAAQLAPKADTTTPPLPDPALS